jgi:hypothetical protein
MPEYTMTSTLSKSSPSYGRTKMLVSIVRAARKNTLCAEFLDLPLRGKTEKVDPPRIDQFPLEIPHE